MTQPVKASATGNTAAQQPDPRAGIPSAQASIQAAADARVPFPPITLPVIPLSIMEDDTPPPLPPCHFPPRPGLVESFSLASLSAGIRDDSKWKTLSLDRSGSDLSKLPMFDPIKSTELSAIIERFAHQIEIGDFVRLLNEAPHNHVTPITGPPGSAEFATDLMAVDEVKYKRRVVSLALVWIFLRRPAQFGSKPNSLHEMLEAFSAFSPPGINEPLDRAYIPYNIYRLQELIRGLSLIQAMQQSTIKVFAGSTESHVQFLWTEMDQVVKLLEHRESMPGSTQLMNVPLMIDWIWKAFHMAKKMGNLEVFFTTLLTMNELPYNIVLESFRKFYESMAGEFKRTSVADIDRVFRNEQLRIFAHQYGLKYYDVKKSMTQDQKAEFEARYVTAQRRASYANQT